MSKISDAIGPQGETESNLDYKLRYNAWKRKKRKQEREQVEAPSEEAQAAEPDESADSSSMRDTVESAWTKSAKYMEDEGI